MKRALLILMLALCLPLLCACGDGMEIEEHAFALSMAIDRTGLGQIRVSLQVLSGSQGAGDGGAQGRRNRKTAARTSPRSCRTATCSSRRRAWIIRTPWR